MTSPHPRDIFRAGMAERERARANTYPRDSPAAERHLEKSERWQARIGREGRRPDLADLRQGRWYDEKPITSTNTGSTGGAGVASIEEVRAGVAASNEKSNEGLGAVQQAHACLEEAQGMLMTATEGSGQGDVSEANGLLAQAVNSLDEVRQQVSAAISAAESVANRL